MQYLADARIDLYISLLDFRYRKILAALSFIELSQSIILF